MNRVVGIDPGKNGGVARLIGNGAMVEPLVYHGSYVDTTELYTYFQLAEPDIICIEEQTIYRGQGGKSSATTMTNYGCLLATAWLYRDFGWAKVITVAPRMWQKVIIPNAKRGETKSASIAWAQREYPEVCLLRTNKSRVPSDGLSDALGIAKWAQMNY